MLTPWAARARDGVGESPEPYEEWGIDERVVELSVRTSQVKDEEEEDERLDLVLGGLVKITNIRVVTSGTFPKWPKYPMFCPTEKGFGTKNGTFLH